MDGVESYRHPVSGVNQLLHKDKKGLYKWYKHWRYLRESRGMIHREKRSGYINGINHKYHYFIEIIHYIIQFHTISEQTYSDDGF